MDTRESLQAFIGRQRENVQSELSVDSTHRRLYHISPNPKIPMFVPREIQRTMPGEDETVKRVCTGITILDCLRGYAVTVNEYLDNTAHCAGKDEWLGGYTIYAFTVDGSLRPSKVLCPISEWCEERWLVNHTQEDQRYVPETIGRCFIDNVRVLTEEHGKIIETSVLIAVDCPALTFSPFFKLKRGFYRMTIPSLEKFKAEPLDHSQVEMQTLTEAEFNEAKQRKAALLSYDLNSKILRWVN